MKFLYPQFLYALGLLSIPIIIHLFNFKRYKTVYFSNVKFLKDIQEETSARSKLKHILILLSRMLAVAFFVLAFAQPFIPFKNQQVGQDANVVSLYIDNSFSMNALSEDMSLIEKAKSLAREIVNTSGEAAKFHLITNDLDKKHQRELSQEEILAFIDELKTTPKVTPLSVILKRQMQDVDEYRSSARYFHISDFQENIVDLKIDSSINLNFIPVQTVERKNVYIDSVWFFEPIQIINQQNSIVVKITNSSDEDIMNSRLSLKINGKIKAISDVNLEANQSVVDTLSITMTEAGWNKAEFQINDYPITFDDTYYLTFNVLGSIPVMVINGKEPNKYLSVYYAENSVFNALNTNLSNVELSTINNQNLIILESIDKISSGLANELTTFVRNGGSLVIFPSGNADLSSYNNMLTGLGLDNFNKVIVGNNKIRDINTKESVFKDVFVNLPDNIRLPSAKKYYPVSTKVNSGREVLLELDNSIPFLSKYKVDKGKVYLFASPLQKEATELPLHAIFVPMIYRIGILSTGKVSTPYTLTNDLNIAIEENYDASEGILKIKGESVEFIPEQNSYGGNIILSLTDQVNVSGAYRIMAPNDKLVKLAAINYDRRESDMDYLDVASLKAKYANANINIIDEIKNIGQVIDELDRGKSLWKLCVIFTLLFLAIEILLLRFLPG